MANKKQKPELKKAGVNVTLPQWLIDLLPLLTNNKSLSVENALVAYFDLEATRQEAKNGE